MSVQSYFKSQHEQIKNNLKNWKYISYNTAGISGGPFIVSGGAQGGILTLEDQHGSRYKYRIADVSIGVGLSSFPVDFDLSSHWLGVPSTGIGALISATGMKPLTARSFEGVCLIYSASGGFSAFAGGYNYIALGARSSVSLPAIAIGGPLAMMPILADSHAVLFETSTGITAFSANIGHNVGIGYCSLYEQTIANTTQPIPTANVGPSRSAERTAMPGARMHVVKEGESLSKIAMMYYGDYKKYIELHHANRAKIGPNPNVIRVGEELVIPPAHQVL